MQQPETDAPAEEIQCHNCSEIVTPIENNQGAVRCPRCRKFPLKQLSVLVYELAPNVTPDQFIKENYPVQPFVKVQMGCCGKFYIYQTADDLPRETVACDCGTPDCFVIKWDSVTFIPDGEE